jgi:hypothetical protein
MANAATGSVLRGKRRRGSISEASSYPKYSSQPPMNGRVDAVSDTRNALHQCSSALRKPPFCAAKPDESEYGPDNRPSESRRRHSPLAMGRMSNRLPLPAAAMPAPLSSSPG